MCGITGVFKLNGSVAEQMLLQKMTDLLKHRGPNGQGVWVSPEQNIGLGHRRLAILDLSENGAQPMHYGGRYTITFNGEIYNYLELRQELIGKGYSFTSDSDTEVLLAAYEEYGAEALGHLDGMFALAIWDEQEKRLFCARDRFGEKPFFYHYVPGKHFVFASEIKSLFAYGIPQQINYRMLYYYLAYDVVENQYDKRETFYDGVQRLESAHYLIVNATGEMKTRRYWQLPDDEVDEKISFEDACERFRELLYESIRRRLRSDVPLGTSLSGGLDSSSIVCITTDLLKGSGGKPKTFSALFDDEAFNEDKYINTVVSATGADSYFVRSDSNTLLNEIDRVFYHQEEPFGSASIIAQWEVMKLASQEGVTVLLDGQGADEPLGGYLHFFRPYFLGLYNSDKPGLNDEIRKYESLRGEHYPLNLRFKMEAKVPKILRSIGGLRRKISNPDYLQHLHPEFVREYQQEAPPFSSHRDLNSALRAATVEYGLEKLLRFSDRNSMAFSREVRLPFLYHKLVEFLFTLPASYKISEGWTKRILRHSMSNLLPSEITWRIDKMGFQPPQEKWLKDPQVREYVGECRKKVVNEKLFKSESMGDDWQAIMMTTLMRFQINQKLPAKPLAVQSV
jgi:asparagine synthase (glutamine-hydrolysing)